MENKLINSIQHAFLWLFYFSRFSVRQFYHQRGLQIASSLAYATLLALVPLVTVMFGFLGGLSVFEDMGDSVQTFIFNNFAPAFGDSIRQYLNEFSQKASKLTTTGVVILVLIALMLMATIDSALNTIWHVRHRRNPVARFLVYWAIISLGPILLGIGLVSTSYLLSTSVVSGVDVSLGFELKKHLLSSIPFLTTSVAFTLIYVLIPNCYVSRKNALIGGVIAAVLFELAKYGFGIYVKSVPTYEAIYGAIAIIPTFLIWMYMSWVIVILGAHITFCLSAFRMEFEKKVTRGSDWTFVDAYKLVCGLWRAQKEGLPLSSLKMKKYGIKLPQFQVNEIMELLLAANWVQRGAGGSWLLCRDLAEVSVLDLYNIIPKRLPMNIPKPSGDSWTKYLHQYLSKHNDDMEVLLSLPLRDLLMQAEQFSDKDE
jgi:membrane protein